MNALAADAPFASLLLISPRRFPRSKSMAELISALTTWLDSDPETRLIEDWLL